MKNYNAVENIKEIERTNPAPAFQFYPKDYIADSAIAILSLEEFGLFMRLVCFLWLEENFAFDEKKLAKLLHISPKKFQKLFAPMKNVFEISNGIIRFQKLEDERQKQANWRAKSSIGGQKSAEARRKGGLHLVDTVVEPTNQPNGNIASSSAFASSSAEEEEPLPTKRRSLDFSETEKSGVVGDLNARARETRETAAAEDEVFNFWKSAFDSPKEISKGYRQEIKKKFDEGFDVADLKAAIRGYKIAAPPESHNVKHSGNFRVIMRDVEKFRRFDSGRK